MQRVTVSLDDDLVEAFDRQIADRGYTSRSEAMRDLLRRDLEAAAVVASGFCVANLSYVYNHHVRSLAQRLTEIAHDHHDLVVATMHVHLDHENCLETVILKGKAGRVRHFADGVRAERGVSFGELNLVAVTSNGHHEHAHSHTPHMTPTHASRSRD